MLTEVARPVPRGEEVLVRVEAAGLCRSDLHVLDATPGTLPYRTPFTLGHEVAGRVAAHGPEAFGPAIGERVVVYGPWGCGRCVRCSAGAENHCDARPALDAAFAGTGAGLGRDGGMADHLLVPSGRLLVPVGDLDPVQAAPLSDAGLTSYHAVAGVRPALGEGASAVVLGVGGLGHLAVRILRATTSAYVLAVDIREEALALAASCGAHFGTLLGPRTAEDLQPAHRRNRGGRRARLRRQPVQPGARDRRPARGRRAGRRGERRRGADRPQVRRAPPGLRISLPFWGTRPELEEVIDLAREGVLTVETEQFPLSGAMEAIDRLRSGDLRGRAVLVPD